MDTVSSFGGGVVHLGHLGFAVYPTAVTAALLVSVVPSTLYGAKAWGLQQLLGVLSSPDSPCVNAALLPIISHLKGLAGLPATSFGGPVYQLFGLPTFFELVLPQVLRFFGILSLDQHTYLQWVAA